MMINDASALRRSAHLVGRTDDYGDWEEWAPLPGLSPYQAVEVSVWCATRNVGTHNSRLWFETFNRCMVEAGFQYLVCRKMYLISSAPPYAFDPGWIAVH
jgi:hypothetical protein